MATPLMNFYYSITGFGENIHHLKEGLQGDSKSRRGITPEKMLSLYLLSLCPYFAYQVNL